MASLAIRRFKTENSGTWDCWVWYATAEGLARKGYDVGWMVD